MEDIRIDTTNSPLAWIKFKALPLKISALQFFHQYHKYEFMAHEPGATSILGELAANSQKLPIERVFDRYEAALQDLLRKPLSLEKNTNVFEHMAGYFKNFLNELEKKTLHNQIQEYRRGSLPFESLAERILQFAKDHSVTYLIQQTFLRSDRDRQEF